MLFIVSLYVSVLGTPVENFQTGCFHEHELCKMYFQKGLNLSLARV